MTGRPAVRMVDCPNCGSGTPLRNPGIVTIVCDNCSTVLLRQEDGFRPGETSLLVDALSGMGGGVVASETIPSRWSAVMIARSTARSSVCLEIIRSSP